ncbi:MAG: alpha-glucuronidase, partial [Betaproteobacteria bacterium]|nr:alpha-glucuronidase [Betaproteobacteria bacterium]
MTTILAVLAPLMLALPANPAQPLVEDGYDLWLRYRRMDDAAKADALSRSNSIVMPAAPSLTTLAAVAELHRGIEGMTGRAPALAKTPGEGALLLLTPANLRTVAPLKLPLEALGKEGYLLRATHIGGHKVTLIAANTDIGLLYGAFAWLRKLQMRVSPQRLDELDEHSAPKIQLRMLNHWDNLDRSVERGYAGESIWDWWTLPDNKNPRYVDYARANASLGINGVSLNNVNAKADILTAPWIAKAAAVADVLRPYGIKVYLSVRFSAPVELAELHTADPLDASVAAWWKAKANEIYRVIPDFGGFLVKANSEGQPGPEDYQRSHADGANMLAAALAPHHGLVLWRAFVYSQHDPKDRAAQAYDDFKPLDGTFAANVIVQVKNGPIDFQPREPFHPLFGAMPATPLALEFQITKEYLGFATHLAYLGPLFEEVLQSDTYRKGAGTTVAKVIKEGRISAMAGVANIGSARNWSGSHFDQANWYVFGRLAWDPDASAKVIAREWTVQTFSTDPHTVDAIVDLMMMSREAVVDYMMPLGLHHLFDTGHHYGPGPWVSNLKRPEWNPTYYHRADQAGIGFDRTAKGSNASAQYAAELSAQWADPHTTPEKFLLWFHHLRWDYTMASGKSLWEEMVAHYDSGVAATADLRAHWDRLKDRIDPQRHTEVAAFLVVQEREAIWWRDASIA